jgi:hypothetical protein
LRNPLWPYRKKISSQYGEDGIIERIFELIGTRNKWCVEFGAWDGKFNSNTHYWIHEHGWSSVLIEAHPEKFKILTEYYADRPNVHCYSAFVGRDNPLDGFLAQAGAPKDLDFLSIDIDGMDYWIWSDLVEYRARVVIIETNATCPPWLRLIPKYQPGSLMSASARAMVELGKSKGYELAAMVQSNCIFVLKEDYPLLGIEDNSLELLFNSPHIPTVISDQAGRHYVLTGGAYGVQSFTAGNPPEAEVVEYCFGPEGDDLAEMRRLERERGEP